MDWETIKLVLAIATFVISISAMGIAIAWFAYLMITAGRD